PIWPQLAATLEQTLLDAQRLDAALVALRAQGRAQFSAIFRADAGFETRSDRFVPYVQELMLTLDALRDRSDWDLPLAIEVKKLGLLMRTMSRTAAETGLEERPTELDNE
ncbi:MAG: hypothetical protein KA754_00545, partial [Corallincola sp.]|nr:hypothetical protein [Corallincola sp.]